MTIISFMRCQEWGIPVWTIALQSVEEVKQVSMLFNLTLTVRASPRSLNIIPTITTLWPPAGPGYGLWVTRHLYGRRPFFLAWKHQNKRLAPVLQSNRWVFGCHIPTSSSHRLPDQTTKRPALSLRSNFLRTGRKESQLLLPTCGEACLRGTQPWPSTR